MDMMCPPSHSAMRPAHIARQSGFLLDRAFCVGSYLWVYDLEEDNTFRRDPAAYQHLRQVIALRQSWLSRYGHGVLTDDRDLLEQPGAPGLILKTFRLERGLLLACANPGSQAVEAALRWNRPEAPRARLYTLDAPESPEEAELRPAAGGYRVSLPGAALCYLTLEVP